MKVKELISKLKELDQEKTICFTHMEYGDAVNIERIVEWSLFKYEQGFDLTDKIKKGNIYHTEGPTSTTNPEDKGHKVISREDIYIIDGFYS